MKKSLLVLLISFVLLSCDKNDDPVVTNDTLTGTELEEVKECVEGLYGEGTTYVIKAVDRLPKSAQTSSTIQFAQKTLRDADIQLTTEYINKLSKKEDAEYMVMIETNTEANPYHLTPYSLMISYTGSIAIMKGIHGG